jgi:hypothetical protein
MGPGAEGDREDPGTRAGGWGQGLGTREREEANPYQVFLPVSRPLSPPGPGSWERREVGRVPRKGVGGHEGGRRAAKSPAPPVYGAATPLPRARQSQALPASCRLSVSGEGGGVGCDPYPRANRRPPACLQGLLPASLPAPPLLLRTKGMRITFLRLSLTQR